MTGSDSIVTPVVRSRARAGGWARCAAVLALAALAGQAIGRPDDGGRMMIGEGWCGCWCAAGHAEPSRRFDEATGRDLRHYPPSPMADFESMRLSIAIDDMNTPRFEATQELAFRPLGRPLSRLTLDAKLLEIASVGLAGDGGHTVAFEHDGRVLTVRFDPPLPVGAPATLVTNYSVTDPPDGLYWTPESPAWPGRPAQLHTQGQPQTNSFWFPCHDFPNDRMTTELVVTAPAGYTVSANGRPEGRTRAGGAETWRWVQDKPHPAYLVSLIVGKFDVVDVGTDRVPMPVYVPPGKGGDVRGTYGRTARMVEHFEELLDEPYPWDRYAQLLVWNFGFGGMENTSATTMFDTAVLSRAARADFDLDGLISHELAHQWFGDLITCRSWEHIWLNEGFATYFSNLWFEERDGADAYAAGVLGNFDAVIANDTGHAPDQPAMVSKEYRRPFEAFGRAANPYPKGASILHMLRRRVGDRLFFESLRVYVDRHRLAEVETSDLRKAFEEVTGDNLEQFFRQWCERPGVPRLTVTPAWDSGNGELAVTVKQTQTIDGNNPAFSFTLPLWVATAEGRGRWAVVEVDGRETTAVFPVEAEPVFVAVDPNLDVLAEIRVEQSDASWAAQLESGPTMISRVMAARALARADVPPDWLPRHSPNDDFWLFSRSQPTQRGEERREIIANDALTVTALNARAHDAERLAALDALAARDAALHVLAISRDLPDDPQVRAGVVNAAARAAENNDAPRAELLAFIATRAGPAERFQTVRAAAISALGRLKSADHLGLVLAAADVESQHDTIRVAALGALADLDAPEGLAAALRSAQPGTLNRTRPAAISAAVRLAHHDPDRAFAAIAPLLFDREDRTWRAAGDALNRLGDPRGVAELERFIAQARHPWDREDATAWLDSLRAAPAAGSDEVGSR